MAKGEVIARLGQPIEYLYFVNRGLISFVKTMRDGRAVEIGVVGVEGISSPHALFGINKAILEALVQVPGTAYRISHDSLKRLMAEDAPLREALEKYVNFYIAAFAQTAACNRLHHLEERCRRWLLIAHDSARSDAFSLTHEFLAMMLGVQRVGVSITAGSLQKAGLIKYRRGHVTITNRSVLEDTACECYRTSAGYRSVQSTPFITQDGRLFGIVSVHFEAPGGPTRSEGGSFNLYSNVAAEQAYELLGGVALAAKAAQMSDELYSSFG